MISSKHKFIFFRIPKSAGKSIDYSLRDYYSERIKANPYLNVCDKACKRKEVFSPHLSYKDLNIFLESGKGIKLKISPQDIEKYFKICFVRNPWCRVFSYFNSQIWNSYRERKNDYKKPVTKGKISRQFNKALTREYKKSKKTYNKHRKTPLGGYNFLRTQQIQYMTSDMSTDGKIVMDFVGRFETLKYDVQELSKKLGLEIKLPDKNLGKTHHNHYSHYYEKEAMGIVKRLFAEDISRFGYEYEDRT